MQFILLFLYAILWLAAWLLVGPAGCDGNSDPQPATVVSADEAVPGAPASSDTTTTPASALQAADSTPAAAPAGSPAPAAELVAPPPIVP